MFRERQSMGDERRCPPRRAPCRRAAPPLATPPACRSCAIAPRSVILADAPALQGTAKDGETATLGAECVQVRVQRARCVSQAEGGARAGAPRGTELRSDASESQKEFATNLILYIHTKTEKYTLRPHTHGCRGDLVRLSCASALFRLPRLSTADGPTSLGIVNSSTRVPCYRL